MMKTFLTAAFACMFTFATIVTAISILRISDPATTLGLFVTINACMNVLFTRIAERIS